VIAFIGHLEEHYGDNPYHNKQHAADVTLGTHRFLADRWGAPPPAVAPSSASPALAAQTSGTRDGKAAQTCATSAADCAAPSNGGGASMAASRGGHPLGMAASSAIDASGGFGLSPLQCLAGLVAAAIHDFAHPGTTNAHEIGASSELAIRYHDEAVLESHHLASAFSALLQPAHNFLAEWDTKAYKEWRKLVIQLVMATDLSRHFDFISSLNSLPPGSLQPASEPAPTLLLSVAIKAADLGHAVKPWPLHYKWTQNVTEEFFRLGDREKAMGLPVSTFCDRGKDTNLAKSQTGFLTFVCLPFYVAAERVLPDAPAAAAVARLKANCAEWDSYVDPHGTEPDLGA